ncbi:MAG: hypothetical protein IJK58_08700, partial [Clostridia bacterium]|nr:hypothetical protein [Clostridia bacterium]
MKFGLGSIKKYLPHRKSSQTEETVYYAPENGMSKTSEYIGIAFRGFTVFCGIFGLVMLMFQSFRLYTGNKDFRVFSLSIGYIIAVCLVFAVLCAVATFNRVTSFAVPFGTLAAAAVAATILHKDPVTLAENTARRLYNGVISGLVASRYTDFAQYLASDKYSFSEETLLKWSVIFVAAFFAVLMYFAVAKKTRATLFVITAALVTVPVFLFNISKGNLGFAFVVACAAGVVSMRIVETRYCGRLEKRTDRRQRREERRRAKTEESSNKKIEKLTVKTVANKVYDSAIEAEMGASRARLARR